MLLDPLSKLNAKQKNKRIVSLVPSLTELFFDLGLEKQIIGRTKFCIHPKDKISEIAIIGGTKNVHINKVKKLCPDLVIANKEENTKEDIELISTFAPVLVTDIQCMEDICQLIEVIESVVPETRGLALIEKIRNMKMANIFQGQKIAYIIWQNPLMTVGNDTFIHYMLSHSGLINVFGDKKRYPVIEWSDLNEKKPDYIFLSSEPYPFNNKHISLFKQNIEKSEILLVDGEMFSWYGSRILKAPDYFNFLSGHALKKI
jgi:iron complex transport system substrate-binding protein